MKRLLVLALLLLGCQDPSLGQPKVTPPFIVVYQGPPVEGWGSVYILRHASGSCFVIWSSSVSQVDEKICSYHQNAEKAQ